MRSSLPKISVVLVAQGQSSFISILKSISCQLLLCQKDFEIIVISQSMKNYHNDDLSLEDGRGGAMNKIKVYQYEKELTEDQAFFLGFSKSCGDIVVFAQAVRDFSAFDIRVILAHLDQFEADIVLGTKVNKNSWPITEKVVNTSFKLLTKFLFGLDMPQTKITLRAYRREVLEVALPQLQVKNSAFDLELLVLARDLGYKKIIYAPLSPLQGGDLDTKFSKLLILARDTYEIFHRKVILNSYQRMASLYQA